MKTLKYILILIAIFLIGSSIYVALLDGNYDIKQTKKMDIASEIIFENINDFKNWQHWGPWYESDPTIVAAFPEKTSGVGASYNWTGKDGNGSMKTISLIQNKELIQQIDFETGSKPEVYWTLNELENGTEVTWGMRGKNSFAEKAFWWFQGGIEKNMKPMYGRGLELLEEHLTKEMEKYSINYKGIVEHGGGYYISQTITCLNEECPEKMIEMFQNIEDYMTANQLTSSGKPFTLNHSIDFENNTTIFSTCVPLREKIETSYEFEINYLKPQKTFKINFNGSYKFLPDSWPEFYKTLVEQGFTPIKKGYSFEIYTVSPNDTPNPANWLTEIYIPIQ
jgi:effector-binding domain-containing protein